MQWTNSHTAMGSEVTGLSAVIETWEGAVAPTAGTWVVTFTSVGYNGGGLVPGQCTVGATDPECVSPPPSAMVDGSWRFEFELPKPTGSVFSTAALASTDVATVKLKTSKRSTRITNCYNLAMCRRVVGCRDKVSAGCNDLPVAHDDRAERPSASGRDVLRRQRDRSFHKHWVALHSARYPYCTLRVARVTE